MMTLFRNELTKLKREFFVFFLLLLSILPVLTGAAGAILNDSAKTVGDLFFFMNNQFSLFFPVVLFILVGSLFYQEYKNKTYINWITYGYAKSKLFMAKVMVAAAIGLLFALIFLALFVLLILVLQAGGKISVTDTDTSLTAIALGFTLQAFILVLVTISAGAIVINLGRNIIVSSVVGVIYGFASAFFIGAESGYVVPGGFAYRVAMLFADNSTYYEKEAQATIGGSVSTAVVFGVLLAVGMLLFSRKRPIEG